MNNFAPVMGSVDPCSYSTPDKIAITNMHFDLYVNTEAKTISGKVKMDLNKVDSSCHTLLLDSKKLEIYGVKDVATDKPLDYVLSSDVSPFGTCIKISLPVEEKPTIEIEYMTDPKSSALQWLDPELTSGKEFPFVFTQCQAIHARALYPCQDTPYVKFTYTADVTVESGLVALMSGLRTGEKNDEYGTRKIFSFRQPVVIPSYLVALAVGRLESKRIGPRSVVWAEKELVEKAAYEFAETEEFLKAAEGICGPYVWGVYDILVLPPSFPYGGMENPCLSFVTPTLLAGDRSLANVIAHEISHSWTGNLVTNKTFEHFWLNEGFTVFIERKILGRLYGEQFRQFHAIEGYLELNQAVSVLGKENPITNLVVNLTGLDPDDTYSTVPYEKGHSFLYYLEELVGGPALFEPFLKVYLQHFKLKSIGTDDFKNFFLNYFEKNTDATSKIDWQSWLHTPGMPLVEPKFDSTLRNTCESLAKRWEVWSGINQCPFDRQDLDGLSSLQKQVFISFLIDSEPFPVWKLEKMDELYGFGKSANSEILFRWYQLCVRGRWLMQVQNVLTFVTNQGRMKFVRPLYRELNKWPEAREKAVSNFLSHQASMMYVSKYTVRKELNLQVSEM